MGLIVRRHKMKIDAFNFYDDEDRKELQFRIANSDFEINFFKNSSDYKLYVNFFKEKSFDELLKIHNLTNGEFIALCNYKKETYRQGIVYTFPSKSCFAKEYTDMIMKCNFCDTFSVTIRKDVI
jgi:hypothetical protein